MINNTLADKQLPVYGDGTNVRDWIYVEDHCRGILAALERGKAGETYNFGGNAEEANLTLVKQLLKTIGKPETLICFVKDQPGHDLRYAMNFAKTQAELKWQPRYEFQVGMKKTVQWFLDKMQWLQQVVSGEYRKYHERKY